jgi:hypothetical protein
MKKSLSYVSVSSLVNMVTRKGGSNADLENLDDERAVDSLSMSMQSQGNASTQSQSEDDFFVSSGNETDINAGNESDSNVLIVDEEAANLEAAVALDEEQAVWKDLAALRERRGLRHASFDGNDHCTTFATRQSQ